jgi:hypothetical protein
MAHMNGPEVAALDLKWQCPALHEGSQALPGGRCFLFHRRVSQKWGRTGDSPGGRGQSLGQRQGGFSKDNGHKAITSEEGSAEARGSGEARLSIS